MVWPVVYGIRIDHANGISELDTHVFRNKSRAEKRMEQLAYAFPEMSYTIVSFWLV